MIQKFLWCFLLCSSIARSEVMIDVMDDRAKVTLLKKKSESSYESHVIGMTPVKVNLESLKNSVIRIEAKDKIPYYWVYLDQIEDSSSFFIEELKKSKTEAIDSIDKKTESMDLSNMFLLNGYRAYQSKQFHSSIKILNQAIQKYPDVSAYYILLGMAHLKQGEAKMAKEMWLHAKSLDPKDPDLDDLLDQLR